MLIVDTSDFKRANRTAANVRAALVKRWEHGSPVLYLPLDNKGVITGDDADAIFLELLFEADADVDDVEAEEGTITVYTAPTDLHKAIAALRIRCRRIPSNRIQKPHLPNQKLSCGED